MSTSFSLPDNPGRWSHIIVHASATPPSLDVGADWVDRVHRELGWVMCGYHVIIRRDGTIEYELNGARTRPINRNGAHVGGCGPRWNKVCFGICMIGGVKEDKKTPENNFTKAQMKSLWAVVSEAQLAFAVPDHNVIGHRDLIKQTHAAPKACPCFSVQAALFAGHDVDSQGRKDFAFDQSKRPPNKKGDKLAVPKTYTCRAGDTLENLSWTYGIKLSAMVVQNNLEDAYEDIEQGLLKAGKKLKFWD